MSFNILAPGWKLGAEANEFKQKRMMRMKAKVKVGRRVLRKGRKQRYLALNRSRRRFYHTRRYASFDLGRLLRCEK